MHTYFDAAAEAPDAAGDQLDIEPAIVAAGDLDGDDADADADAEPPHDAQQVRALWLVFVIIWLLHEALEIRARTPSSNGLIQWVNEYENEYGSCTSVIH